MTTEVKYVGQGGINSEAMTRLETQAQKMADLSKYGGVAYGKAAKAAGILGAEIEAEDVVGQIEIWSGVDPSESGALGGETGLGDVEGDPMVEP